METRANYVLTGLLSLAVMAAVFGFVYWFQNIGGTSDRAWYRVVFEGSVSGLRTGGAVLFNGIRVGEVTGLKLNPQRPRQVIATVSIDKSAAVRPDTQIGLERQGLTGIASLALQGGDPSKPVLVGSRENPPVLIAPLDATSDFTQAARDTLRKLDNFLSENQGTFSSMLKNVDRFTATLAENSKRIGNALAHIDEFTVALARSAKRVDKILAGIHDLADVGQLANRVRGVVEVAALAGFSSDNLYKRTASILSGVSELTTAGAGKIRAIASDTYWTLSTRDRAVSNLGRSPGGLNFGGRRSSLPEDRAP